MGVHIGVQRHSTKLCFYLIGMHSSAHRTALVMNDAGARRGSLQLVDSILKVCAKATKRQQKWEDFAKARNVKCIKFPYVCGNSMAEFFECLDILWH